jgi:hypothetical protein
MKKLSNILSIHYPELLLEWNYIRNQGLSPDDITYRSKKKVWWICSKTHSWIVSVAARSLGSKCPYCSGRRASLENCLEAKFPAVSLEWNYEKNYPITPRDVMTGSIKKVWWKCSKGHEWR